MEVAIEKPQHNKACLFCSPVDQPLVLLKQARAPKLDERNPLAWICPEDWQSKEGILFWKPLHEQHEEGRNKKQNITPASAADSEGLPTIVHQHLQQQIRRARQTAPGRQSRKNAPAP